MARLESVAVAGFFATPLRVVEAVAASITPNVSRWETLRLLDPCAGEGEAIHALATTLGANVLACELERTRCEALREKFGEHSALHGDAFRVEFAPGLTDLLYLNPPYDQDPVHGRLEERWLARFTPALAVGGLLVFVVPHYALSASATSLALDYEEVCAFRFPEPEAEAFKQCVVFARRVERTGVSDPEVEERARRWATTEGFAAMRGIPASGGFELRQRRSGNLWQMRPIDLVGLVARHRPWSFGNAGRLRSVEGVMPEGDFLQRTFPVAVAPRPAHVAAALASGLFNGKRVSSDRPGKPDLLVKGVFEREFVTVEQKRRAGDDEVIGEYRVQQPRLVVVGLDAATGAMFEARPASVAKPGEATIEGLIDDYGSGLLRVMLEQCPVSYDPARDAGRIELPKLKRKLFEAQAHAARALLEVLSGEAKTALLMGEIGVGKSTVALAVACQLGSRPLVLCPPHLLDSWRNEVRACLPGVPVEVLSSVEDVDRLALRTEEVIVAVMSREAAKLGHGLEGVGRRCGSCGAPDFNPSSQVRLRRNCANFPIRAKEDLSRAAYALAWALAPAYPEDQVVRAFLPGRAQRIMAKRWGKREPHERPSARLDPALFERLLERPVIDERSAALAAWCAMLSRPEVVFERSRAASDKESPWYERSFAKLLALLLPEAERNRARSHLADDNYPYGRFEEMIERAAGEHGLTCSMGTIRLELDGPTLEGIPHGSPAAALKVLRLLVAAGSFRKGKSCGEPLYQAIAEPRRYPLARYVARRHPRLFDFFIADEQHEYSTSADSAQSHAMQRIAALGRFGMPVLAMTGSVMNGYARSLFTTFQVVDPDFRKEFRRGDLSRFVDRYGYRKIYVQDVEDGEVVEFGTHSDRVKRNERNVGEAPGVLPLFLFRHLLARSVTLQKADLALELPPCRQLVEAVEPGEELNEAYVALLNHLQTAIMRDRFVEGRSGKLFGALSEFPSYLDRASVDVGNQEGGGAYQVRYPEALGSELVAEGATWPASWRSPKELRLLEKLREELAEGRNCIVFGYHTEVVERLARIVASDLGEKVEVLRSEKVPTSKRQAWIQERVVDRGIRVLVANPTTVQTGLNNLVHFATEFWVENPAVNPIVFRQAVGRVDRIGQKKETRIYVLYYAGTLQGRMHELLMQKVAVSTATDGLDPESVLLAAGGGGDAVLAGMSLGRELWNLLERRARGEAA